MIHTVEAWDTHVIHEIQEQKEEIWAIPHNTLGVLFHGARTMRHLSDVSGDFTQCRGPPRTTLAGVPKCLWMVARGLWMIPRVHPNFARCVQHPQGAHKFFGPKKSKFHKMQIEVKIWEPPRKQQQQH